jgi:hypothetical protein
VFNNGGAPFDINTFPSEFSAVWIVVSPCALETFLESRLSVDRTEFYRVSVLTRPGYPAVSSAAKEKVVSRVSLPGYVRNLALNDCVLSLMTQEGYLSSWRSRLEQIRSLGRKYGA